PVAVVPCAAAVISSCRSFSPHACPADDCCGPLLLNLYLPADSLPRMAWCRPFLAPQLPDPLPVRGVWAQILRRPQQPIAWPTVSLHQLLRKSCRRIALCTIWRCQSVNSHL